MRLVEDFTANKQEKKDIYDALRHIEETNQRETGNFTEEVGKLVEVAKFAN
mgnify:CR=1 FL=1